MTKRRLSRNAVKEAIDNLPSGLCFFNKNGLPVLCNRVMHQLVFALTGRDLQVMSELSGALEALPENSTATRDGDVFLLADGTAWQFSHGIIRGENAYTEYVATDISELYRREKDLETSTAEHEQLVLDMKRIVENLTAITREEEILTMKMQIHGKVGWCLQQLRRYYAAGCPEDKKDGIVEQLRSVAGALRGEVGNDDEIDALTELLRVASTLGVTVELTGKAPEESGAKNLLIAAMRECITNTQRHAGGDRVTVSVTSGRGAVRAVLTNNGRQPTETIVEGGGFASLRKKIEKAGGTMAIQSLPFFALTVTIPTEKEEEP